MKTLLTLVRRVCRIAGFAGMFLAVWMFFDPSAFPDANFGLVQPPSPRWRAVLLFVFSLLVVAFGSGLAHRKLP